MTYYWQLKEYRWDRMREFLIQQRGTRIFFNVFHLLLLTIVLGFLVIYLISGASNIYFEWFPMMVAVLMLAELFRFSHHFILRGLTRPKLTYKAWGIMVITLLIELLVIYLIYKFWSENIALMEVSFVLALLVLLESDINALIISILRPIELVFKKRIFRKAHLKRLAHPELIVIGITGSYGKTTVKEYLSHILEGKFRVLKTPLNVNTEMGIAQTIMTKLSDDHQIFVCEMGAYRIGEVKICSQMVNPKIGIFTGLNSQHLALFGSMDNTFQAKWELIASLSENGSAIINGESPELLNRLTQCSARMLVCRSTGDNPTVSDIEVGQSDVSFVYQSQKFIANVVGAFQVINITMAIVAAEKMGMSLAEIANRVRTLRPPEKTMSLRHFKYGVVIDDSYNVNKDGFEAALTHLDEFEDDIKIVIFPGILELGEKMEQAHDQLGVLVGQQVDYAFFTDPVFAEYLQAGARRNGLSRDRIMVEYDQGKILKKIREIIQLQPTSKYVVLVESRGADKVKEALLRDEYC